MMATELFGGDEKAAVYPAVAFELLHNFTLIHDDIMDEAPIRRGQPTVYKKWNANIAILAGDALAALALQEIMKTPCDKNIVVELAMLLSQTSTEVCEGQQYDLDFEELSGVTLKDYMKMIHLKTAVMLAGCLKAGAILSGASPENQELIYNFGINIGLAFQLKDDLLDIYGDDTIFGKVNGGDIKENKKTYLFLRALQDGDEIQRKRLLHYFSSTNIDFEEKFSAVKFIYGRLNIFEKTEELIQEYLDQALENLEDIEIDDENRKKALKKLASELTVRKK